MDAEKYRFERNEDERNDFALASQAASEGRMLTLADKDRARRDLQSLHSATHQSDINPNSMVAPSDGHHIGTSYPTILP